LVGVEIEGEMGGGVLQVGGSVCVAVRRGVGRLLVFEFVFLSFLAFSFVFALGFLEGMR
jgi:hypothetical protein